MQNERDTLEYDLWDEDQDGMDSPGTSPEYVYDEATSEYIEVDCEGMPYDDAPDIEATPDRTQRIGPRMLAIRDYMTCNPGASVTQTLYATHMSRNWRWWNHACHRKAVYRAEAAGLIVIDQTQSNRYRLYDAELYRLERGRAVPRVGIAPAAGTWTPGHP